MKSPAFSFYVRDWLCSKTVSKLHSKPCSKGVSCYLFLLCSAWLEEPPATLPDNDQELAGLGRVSLEEWAEIKPLIIHQFPLLPSGRRFNERLMEEWEKQQKRKFAGSKGGSKTSSKTQAKRVAALEDEDEDENVQVYSVSSRVALHWLNEQSGKHFRECESSLAPIHARLKENGVDIEGVKKMISRQCLQWKGDKMEEFLRPQTLFGKQKFDAYYASRDQPIHSPQTNGASGSKGFDRNKGTLNEGKAARYDLKAIQAARAIRDKRQPELGSDA